MQRFRADNRIDLCLPLFSEVVDNVGGFPAHVSIHNLEELDGCILFIAIMDVHPTCHKVSTTGSHKTDLLETRDAERM